MEILNRSSVSVEFDLWKELEPPGGGVLTSSPRSMSLGPGQSLTLRARQRIPPEAPPGTYALRGLVGAFPVAEDSDTFTFRKIPAS